MQWNTTILQRLQKHTQTEWKSATPDYLPDKMQMIENTKLFTGSCCDSLFPACSSERCNLAKLNGFFSLFLSSFNDNT